MWSVGLWAPTGVDPIPELRAGSVLSDFCKSLHHVCQGSEWALLQMQAWVLMPGMSSAGHKTRLIFGFKPVQVRKNKKHNHTSKFTASELKSDSIPRPLLAFSVTAGN